VTDIVGSRFDSLVLLDVSVTNTIDYNSPHIELVLDNESPTVVWLLNWYLVSGLLSLFNLVVLSLSDRIQNTKWDS
jgi:hypothetical protein